MSSEKRRVATQTGEVGAKSGDWICAHGPSLLLGLTLMKGNKPIRLWVLFDVLHPLKRNFRIDGQRNSN